MSPLANICVDAWPEIPQGYDLLCGSDARVRENAGCQKPAADTGGHIWPEGPSTDIAKESGSCGWKGYLLERWWRCLGVRCPSSAPQLKPGIHTWYSWLPKMITLQPGQGVCSGVGGSFYVPAQTSDLWSRWMGTGCSGVSAQTTRLCPAMTTTMTTTMQKQQKLPHSASHTTEPYTAPIIYHDTSTQPH